MQRSIKTSALGLLVSAGCVACGAAPSDGESEIGSVEQALSVLLQAENANIGNSVIETEHTGWTGTGYVNNVNAVGSYIEWTVNAPAAGSAILRFRYANGSGARPVNIVVNGQTVFSNFSFSGTGAWSTWTTASTTVGLVAGNNTVRLVATSSTGGPNYDSLEVELDDGPAPGGYVWPVVGTQAQDWIVNRYFDVEWNTGFRDYMGGTQVGKDGHFAIDIDIPSFAQMDDNSAQVVAVAPGTVLYQPISNQPDRNTFENGSLSNEVIIAQDDGREAWYLHFKQNSITVSQGDRVEAGDVLGVVGSSGNSTQPHLHFELRDPVLEVDPFGLGLWESPPAYVVPAKLFNSIVIQEGAFNDSSIKESPIIISQIERGKTIGFGAHVVGGEAGEQLVMELRRPDNVLVQEVRSAFLNYGHTYWYNDYPTQPSDPLGAWRVDVYLAGQFQGSWPINVVGQSTGPTTYQAEAGTWNNATVDSNHSGYTGSGFVNTANQSGTWLEWTVNAASAGVAQIDVRYANGGSARPTSLMVNGQVVNSNFVFGGTGAWNAWQNASFSANLNAGNNTIRITGTSAASCPNFDSLDVTQ